MHQGSAGMGEDVSYGGCQSRTVVSAMGTTSSIRRPVHKNPRHPEPPGAGRAQRQLDQGGGRRYAGSYPTSQPLPGRR
jgi:hypothetical protein